MGIHYRRPDWTPDQSVYLTWVVIQNRHELRMDRVDDMISTWEPSEVDQSATDWEKVAE